MDSENHQHGDIKRRLRTEKVEKVENLIRNTPKPKGKGRGKKRTEKNDQDGVVPDRRVRGGKRRSKGTRNHQQGSKGFSQSIASILQPVSLIITLLSAFALH